MIHLTEKHLQRPDIHPMLIIQRLVHHHRLTRLAVRSYAYNLIQIFVLCQGFLVQRFTLEVLDNVTGVEWCSQLFHTPFLILVFYSYS